MHALDVLGDPTRRRILELLAARGAERSGNRERHEPGEVSAGEIVEVITRELGITQGAVSQHLKVLRDNGFASVRADGQRRLYVVETSSLKRVDAWLAQFRPFWEAKLDALGAEIERGKRKRRHRKGPSR